MGLNTHLFDEISSHKVLIEPDTCKHNLTSFFKILETKSDYSDWVDHKIKTEKSEKQNKQKSFELRPISFIFIEIKVKASNR